MRTCYTCGTKLHSNIEASKCPECLVNQEQTGFGPDSRNIPFEVLDDASDNFDYIFAEDTGEYLGKLAK